MLDEIYSILVKEAKKSFELGEVPISAIIVKENKIIAKAHNLKEKRMTSLAHAELLVIEKATKKLKNWRLEGCDIYISLEPCSMCASAIHQSRIDNIYYFTKRKDCENFKIISDIIVEKNSNKTTKIEYLEYGDDFKVLLQDFFKNRR